MFSPVAPTHVDLFTENYDQLKGWALHFTERDQELAEDLLHDTFIQFTLSKPDLDLIQNVEGYLYIVMRNLHLSQIRRGGRAAMRSLTAVEYDTADVSFWASDPRDRIRMRDELAAVCRYACIRKETAKAASVLILRFFHGYYPDEIARVVRSNRSAVEKRLKSARIEARAYLENAESLSFIYEKTSKVHIQPTLGSGGDDLRFELRKQIFGSRQGDCRVETDLTDLYDADRSEDGLDRPTVAHIVSCQTCLEAVNALLGLESLATRYPQDTIGKDPGKKDGGSGDGGGSGGGPGGSKMLDTLMRRRDAHFYHQPEELCVSVNGQLQSFQKVVAGKGDLTLIIDTNETLGFVEIFSEQGLRLLMLNVEPPPEGDGKQAAHVTLSGGRTIDANLTFGGPHPSLQVTYNDPSQVLETASEIAAALNTEPVHVPFEDSISTGTSFFDRIRTWFEPMRIAVAAAVLMVAAIGIWYVNQTPTSEPLVARTVLKQARDAEFALAPTADKVLHRNYQVEEWANGDLKTRKRIDEWRQSTVNARRTYDESGRMVAGTWTNADGSQRVFIQGERLRNVYKRDANNEFTYEPTANAFANLIDQHGVASKVTVEETASQYVFNFEDRKGETAQVNMPNRLLVASLTLDRETYNPISQTITLQIGNETREYRFSDVRVEQKPITEVSPLIFEPEAELAKGATTVTKPLDIEMPKTAPGTTTADTTTARTATLETEVEVFKALDSINALSGDQISITRTASGQLKVVGIVDSISRKTEVLNALSNIRNAPGLAIDVQTAAEAAAKQKQTITGDNITIESRTAEVNRQSPVEVELRNHLKARGIGEEAMNAEVRSFTNSVLNRAEALSRNALALKSLAERFSPAEIERLEPKRRDEWRRLLRSKAAAVSADVRSLQSQLSLFGGGVSGGGGGDLNDPAGSAQRLFGLAAACERQVNQSFAISSGGGLAAPVKSVQFWRNLGQMAHIAADLQKF